MIHFLTWMMSCTDVQGKLCKCGCHVNHKQLRPNAWARVWLFQVERWQRTKVILCHSSRDSREDKEFYQGKTVKTHSNILVVLAHIQLKSFYCEAGRGPGNEAIKYPHYTSSVSLALVVEHVRPTKWLWSFVYQSYMCVCRYNNYM